MRLFYLFLGAFLIVSCNQGGDISEDNKPDLYYGNHKTIEDFGMRGLVEGMEESEISLSKEQLSLIKFDSGSEFSIDINKIELDTSKSKKYTFDTSGNLIADDWDYYSFDEGGNLIRITKKNRKHEGKPYSVDFKYNGAGKLVEAVEPNGHTIYKYEGNMLTQGNWSDYEGSALRPIIRNIYKFDDSGRVILHRRRQHDYYLYSYTGYDGSFVYDTSGHMKEGGEEITDSYAKTEYKGGKIFKRSGYDLYVQGYNEKLTHEKLREFSKSKDQIIVTPLKSEHTYKYNGYGDIIELVKIRIDRAKTETDVTKYKYMYDSEKNWIVKITYYNSHSPDVGMRKIKYSKKRFL